MRPNPGSYIMPVCFVPPRLSLQTTPYKIKILQTLPDLIFFILVIKVTWCKSNYFDWPILVAAAVPKPETTNGGLTPTQAKEKASALKRGLLVDIDRLGDSLPSNTLDELIDSLGGCDKVAEVRAVGGAASRGVAWDCVDAHRNLPFSCASGHLDLRVILYSEEEWTLLQLLPYYISIIYMFWWVW